MLPYVWALFLVLVLVSFRAGVDTNVPRPVIRLGFAVLGALAGFAMAVPLIEADLEAHIGGYRSGTGMAVTFLGLPVSLSLWVLLPLVSFLVGDANGGVQSLGPWIALTIIILGANWACFGFYFGCFVDRWWPRRRREAAV